MRNLSTSKLDQLTLMDDYVARKLDEVRGKFPVLNYGFRNKFEQFTNVVLL